MGKHRSIKIPPQAANKRTLSGGGLSAATRGQKQRGMETILRGGVLHAVGGILPQNAEDFQSA
jgi:hypothetical protein